MNKTKVNLKNNIILKSENIEYNDDTLKNYLDAENIFSSEETVIGRWKDGKTLYRKVITINGLSTSTIKSIPYNIENVDKIWIENGFICSPERVVVLPEVGYNGELNSKTDIWIEKATNTINLYSNGGWGNEWEINIFLNYTKTT